MLSHLRFHRRGPSNPTSPNPDPVTSPSPWDHSGSASPLRPPPSFQDASSRPDGRPQSSGSGHLPPTLPPITRVTSSESEPPPLLDDFSMSTSPLATSTVPAPAPTTSTINPTTTTTTSMTTSTATTAATTATNAHDTPKTQRQQPVRSPFSEESGFMGGIALQKYRQEQQQLLNDQQQPSQHPAYQQSPRRPDLVSSASTPASSSAPKKPTLTSSFAATPATSSSRSPPESLPVKSPYDSLLNSSFSPNQARGPPSTSGSASAAAPSHGAQFNMAPPSRAATSFASPTDLHSSQQTTALLSSQSQPVTGKRPVGARLATEPPNVTAAANNAVSDPPKGRKGLPFLKNPMSTLLARRKTNQNVPDIAPLPLEQPPQHLANLANDPRIRGTRVHDFSAPRKKQPVQLHVAEPPLDENRNELAKTSSRDTLDHGHVAYQQRHKSTASDSGQSGSVAASSSQVLADAASIVSHKTGRRASHAEQKPLPEDPPVLPPKDENATSQPDSVSIRSTASISAKNGNVADSASLRKAAVSQRMNISREASQSGASGKDVLSAVPKHMKSTSSRFSFDMIGAAKQEKLLEERHRQRELERGPASPEPDPNRDSRFDDFDEDGFDYDAMMDGEDDGFDDGFYEESIPEIGGDYDDMEEEPVPETRVDDYDDDATQRLSSNDSAAGQDPDDDQENFSGFVFQRSNPASELTSPRSAGLLVTPRDAEGKVIGLATWKEATPVLGAPSSPDVLPGDPMQGQADDPRAQLAGDGQVAGLGIQGLDLRDAPEVDRGAMPATLSADNGTTAPQRPRNDDLYYDGGLLDDIDEFAGNGDGSTFDESLFDLDDTDQYGRPIPGAFAAAQAAHQAAKEQEKLEKEHESKRVSDSTSRLSAQSEASPSTAHTSVSAGVQQRAQAAEETERDSLAQSPPHAASNSLSEPAPSEQDKMAVYQAALAAAAYEAAADGRFRRDSSPPPSDTMPTNGASASLSNHDLYKEEDAGLDLYEDFGDDEFGYEDMNDYDLDEDAFIAEANADALASDYDGWYGSEFGFYSAPGSQRHSRDNSGGSGEKPFEFANGGYFGPSGVDRSKSGRIVSREPNLTPITERSEYSNRNSIMSLGVPQGLNSGPSSLASPGLAQLAMLSDHEENMSLTALMKLRSRAWGGSQISLGSSREGSPRSERADGASSPWGERGVNFLGVHGHARKGSAFSARSRDFDSSDAGSVSGSPTTTMAMPALSSPSGPPPLLTPSSSAANGFFGGLLNPTSPLSFGASMPSPGMVPTSFESVLEAQEPQSPQYSASISSPDTIKSPDFMHHPNLMASPNLSGRPPSQQSQGSVRSAPSTGSRKRPGHKHKGSADSISYVQEEGVDGGEKRWVLEKRYTGETGEVEVEREFVQEGRI